MSCSIIFLEKSGENGFGCGWIRAEDCQGGEGGCKSESALKEMCQQKAQSFCGFTRDDRFISFIGGALQMIDSFSEPVDEFLFLLIGSGSRTCANRSDQLLRLTTWRRTRLHLKTKGILRF
uniref:Uncharacterized protein n=1 Tax=Ditylenchus dipsaci TaxID=166011 RepID=A0A915DS53_9BILA